jgi:PKD repeat protein
VNAGPDQTSNEGQAVLFDGSSSSDPDGDALSFSWSFGDGLAGAGATPTHVYADNGSYTATLTVTDEFGGVSSSSLTVNVHNVTPTLDLGGDQTINENGVVTIPSASFTDAGFDCATCSPGSVEGFTAWVDWGEGTTGGGTISKTPGAPGVYTSGTITGAHLYGDNGTYTVKVCLSDDDGAAACRTFNVTVANVAPTVWLNRNIAINFGGGEAFLGRRGERPDFSAESSDVGTDDLTFVWSFPPSALGSTTTYFNNALTGDPPQSPSGLFPFTVNHPNQTTFDDPGVYTAGIRVLDDDGGDATTSLPLLITDNLACVTDWKQQFGRKGSPLIDAQRLAAYLSIVRFASPYFDDHNLATLAQAEEILRSQGGNPFLWEVRKEALEAWLNFASGGVAWGDPVRSLNRPFSQVMAEVDAVMLDPHASRDDYKRSSAAARNVNQTTCSGR